MKVKSILLPLFLLSIFLINTNPVYAAEHVNKEKCVVIQDELDGFPIEESEDVTFKLYIDNEDMESTPNQSYFDKVECIKRNGVWSQYKSNENVLKQQYYCHVAYGTLKTPWNIEPHKSSINSFTCN